MEKDRNFWIKATKRHQRLREEFEDMLGEVVEKSVVIDKTIEEYYERMRELVESTYNTVRRGSAEAEYQKEMLQRLEAGGCRVQEEVEEEIQGSDGTIQHMRMDICEYIDDKERVVFELKKSTTQSGVKQLMRYLTHINSVLGFLVCFRSKNVELYMFMKEDMYENCDYICYDGKRAYKYLQV